MLSKLLEWVAQTFDFAGIVPGIPPIIAFVLAVVSAAIGLYLGTDSWAEIAFGIAIVFAIISLIWGLVDGLPRAILAVPFVFASGGGAYEFYLIKFASLNMALVDKSPAGCVMIEGRTAEECVERYQNRAIEMQQGVGAKVR